LISGRRPDMTMPVRVAVAASTLALGHECVLFAPSLVPTRPGDRVKTDLRGAVTQAWLFRSGELKPVWVPDDAHEAMRDLCRAREAAMEV
jgi:transposase